MSLLILVRHGQASFGEADYDQLSSLGERQSEQLGKFWEERGSRFSTVFCGPLRRHGQTLTAVSHIYPHLPQSQLLPQLAEHQAMEIFTERLPQLAKQDDKLGGHVRCFLAGENPSYHRLWGFVEFTQQWSAGEQPSGSFEQWAAFRRRVEEGVQHMIAAAAGRDETIVAFTSGGVIAAATGYALGVDDMRTMGLNTAVYNASLTTFRFSGTRFSLSQFNAVPHLDEPSLLTYI